MQDTGVQGFASLGADINKRKHDGTDETKVGVSSEKLPELELSMSDEEIVKLTAKWQQVWDDSPAKNDWEKMYKEAEEYWLGKQFDRPHADKSRAMVDNLIFESLETYLPQVTRRNPEPLISLDHREEADPSKDQFVEKTKDRLTDLADTTKLRLKLKKAARHWAVYMLGVAKFGWDLDKDLPTVRIIRPSKLILDPDATVDEDGYTGRRIGEFRKLEAGTILAIIGNSEDELDDDGQVVRKGNGNARKVIKEEVKEDLATELTFIEWWTPEFMCWQYKKTILFKKKNPHWNYDRGEIVQSVDDFGNETPREEKVEGINHFPVPLMPYEFLSVFNLGDQPMDKTSLINQNLSNQDMVNKRNRQIDKNIDRMNGGMVISMDRSGLTQAQAKAASSALRKGGVVTIPTGSPRDAIDTYQPNGLPSDVFNNLADTRGRLRDIFGTQGSTPAGIQQEDTVRGKIINRGLDTDRIGGGVSEYLEQFADGIYNWFVQLFYVYDPGFQLIQGGKPPKLIVSVKEGSLLPKDSISIANQALELASMQRISNIDLYKRLDYPNPEELAANTWLEANAPHLLYRDNPMVQEAMQQAAQAAGAAEQPQPEATPEEGGEQPAVPRSILSEVPENAV